MIMKNFADKEICYVNTPRLSARYRDKLLVKKVLLRNRIPTPPLHKIRGPEGLRRLPAKGALFVKPRYGSMGKGITYIDRSGVKTNFAFRKKRILSRKSDYGWHFRNIAHGEEFLKKLFKADVYSERAVEALTLGGRKFDLRVYVFYGKVLFVYPRSAGPEAITTNISQGGRGEYPVFMRYLPKRIVGRIRRAALETAGALGLNFAGVDIIVDRDIKDIYVLDVNVFAGFPKKKIFNLAAHLTKEIKSQATLSCR